MIFCVLDIFTRSFFGEFNFLLHACRSKIIHSLQKIEKELIFSFQKEGGIYKKMLVLDICVHQIKHVHIYLNFYFGIIYVS
jgi:hypothetical protein